MNEQIKEAVEILNNNTTKIQILSSFADKEYCGKALQICIDLAQQYLSIQGFPGELDKNDMTINPNYLDGFNEARHLCKLAYIKKMEEIKERCSVEKIKNILDKAPNDGYSYNKELAKTIHSAIGGEG